MHFKTRAGQRQWKYELEKTLQKLEVWDQKKCLDMWHSSIDPNLYVDYRNIINFAVTALASEGQLNMGRIYHKIGQNGLSVPGDISEARVDTAKWIIFP